MKNLKIITNVFIFVFMALWIIPEVEIEGQIRLVGTSLFPGLVITTSDEKTYYLTDELFEKFEPYQNQIISIRAKVEEAIIEFADGSEPVILFTIYEAEILEVR